MSRNATVHNRRTVQAHEHHARDYAAAVTSQPAGTDAEALRRFATAIAEGGSVLEIGSGPGRDADFLETLGIAVHRTDARLAQAGFAFTWEVDIDGQGGPWRTLLERRPA